MIAQVELIRSLQFVNTNSHLKQAASHLQVQTFQWWLAAYIGGHKHDFSLLTAL